MLPANAAATQIHQNTAACRETQSPRAPSSHFASPAPAFRPPAYPLSPPAQKIPPPAPERSPLPLLLALPPNTTDTSRAPLSPPSRLPSCSQKLWRGYSLSQHCPLPAPHLLRHPDASSGCSPPALAPPAAKSPCPAPLSANPEEPSPRTAADGTSPPGTNGSSPAA